MLDRAQKQYPALSRHVAEEGGGVGDKKFE